MGAIYGWLVYSSAFPLIFNHHKARRPSTSRIANRAGPRGGTAAAAATAVTRRRNPHCRPAGATPVTRPAAITTAASHHNGIRSHRTGDIHLPAGSRAASSPGVRKSRDRAAIAANTAICGHIAAKARLPAVGSISRTRRRISSCAHCYGNHRPRHQIADNPNRPSPRAAAAAWHRGMVPATAAGAQNRHASRRHTIWHRKTARRREHLHRRKSRP